MNSTTAEGAIHVCEVPLASATAGKLLPSPGLPVWNRRLSLDSYPFSFKCKFSIVRALTPQMGELLKPVVGIASVIRHLKDTPGPTDKKTCTDKRAIFSFSVMDWEIATIQRPKDAA